MASYELSYSKRAVLKLEFAGRYDSRHILHIASLCLYYFTLFNAFCTGVFRWRHWFAAIRLEDEHKALHDVDHRYIELKRKQNNIAAALSEVSGAEVTTENIVELIGSAVKQLLEFKYHWHNMTSYFKLLAFGIDDEMMSHAHNMQDYLNLFDEFFAESSEIDKISTIRSDIAQASQNLLFLTSKIHDAAKLFHKTFSDVISKPARGLALILKTGKSETLEKNYNTIIKSCNDAAFTIEREVKKLTDAEYETLKSVKNRNFDFIV